MNTKYLGNGIILVCILALSISGVQAQSGILLNASEDTSLYGLEIQSDTGLTERVSVASDGTEGDNISWYSSISSEGRFIAFESEASNLVSGDTNGVWDIFIHDRQTSETERVSVSSDRTQGTGVSKDAIISTNGNFVAFWSGASNLVINDTNASNDIFIYDRINGLTTRVSISSEGIQGNNSSHYPSISGDGRYIAFSSNATNLISGDTNEQEDIFVFDRNTEQTTRISLASDGTQASGRSFLTAISADGRYVGFNSSDSNLVSGDTNENYDAFIHDRHTGITERISVANDGTQGNGHSYISSFSADGRYAAFSTHANNFVDMDINEDFDVFIYNMFTKEITLVSFASDGTPGNDGSLAPYLSADGRFVVFESDASNLVVGDTNNVRDVFLHDQQTGQTELVSVASDGTYGNNMSYGSAISADGRCVGFSSAADNLVPGDTLWATDVFVRNCFSFISGKVTDSYGSPIPGVIIYDNVGHETITNSSGEYILDGLAPGTYTIAPTMSDYPFLPSSLEIKVPPNTDDAHFTGKRAILQTFIPIITR